MRTLLIFLLFSVTVWAQNFHKVISLSPALTEIIFFTGNGKKLIADTRYCTVPKEAEKKEKIGGIINPNVEKIVSLHPDLVLAMNGNPQSTIKTIKKFKIPVITFKITTVQDIANAIIKIGNILSNNGEEKARTFLRSYKEKEKKLSQCIKDKKVLVIFSVNPIYTAGSQTFLGEIIKDAGAVNVAGNGTYKTISPEFILKHKPDIIILISTNSVNPIFKHLQAKSIHISGEYLLKPGPYIVKGIEELEEKICQEK
ncbi:ABC transporter substrate-binding protein [Desulfurobacterium sp.]